ncbi:hypothetical protein [Peribacillus frigoritolerans]|uniref:hypothetical protein n=1 Tax=Peribacillus frigoritolerans TaxID=450367 RepID=UPI002E1A5D7C|nr:hypothetical protein [Peribacillus frigoritolerans]
MSFDLLLVSLVQILVNFMLLLVNLVQILVNSSVTREFGVVLVYSLLFVSSGPLLVNSVQILVNKI